jgi:aryl-alcohol dehydrogenase-like predicted oxidoreductase
LKHVRDGAPISGDTIEKTIESSLKRLQTDYIDLYQFHWPNRGSYMFRKNWNYDPSSQNKQKTIDNMLECLKALEVQVQKGNIRYFGLSNESAWGTAQWLRLSETNSLPRVQTIQNEYSLLCRLYDTDLAELSINEDVGLLAFSALATGLLTGKYQNNKVPADSRKSISPELGGRATDRVWLAVDKYMEISAKYQIDPVHLSIAWCSSRPFMCSTIIGATNVDQLSHILGSQDVEISEDCLVDIDNAHKEVPMPF